MVKILRLFNLSLVFVVFMLPRCTLLQGAHRSWKVQFKIQNFQACKVTESGLCARKSW